MNISGHEPKKELNSVSILLIIELLAIILVSDLEQGINSVSLLLNTSFLFRKKKKMATGKKRKKKKFSLEMARHAFNMGSIMFFS